MSAFSVRASLAALITAAALAACGTTSPAHPAATHHDPGTTPAAPAIPAPAATHAVPAPAATHAVKPKHKKKHKKPATTAPVAQAPPVTQAPPPVTQAPPPMNSIPQNDGGDHDADNNGGPIDGDGNT